MHHWVDPAFHETEKLSQLIRLIHGKMRQGVVDPASHETEKAPLLLRTSYIKRRSYASWPTLTASYQRKREATTTCQIWLWKRVSLGRTSFLMKQKNCCNWSDQVIETVRYRPRQRTCCNCSNWVIETCVIASQKTDKLSQLVKLNYGNVCHGNDPAS